MSSRMAGMEIIGLENYKAILWPAKQGPQALPILLALALVPPATAEKLSQRKCLSLTHQAFSFSFLQPQIPAET